MSDFTPNAPQDSQNLPDALSNPMETPETPVSTSEPIFGTSAPQIVPTPLAPPAPTSAFAPITAPQLSPAQLRNLEPIAPEPARAHAATNPLLALLVGALMSAALLGTGILIGRGTPNAAGFPGGEGTSGVNPSSGNAIVRAAAKIGPAVMNVDTDFGDGSDKDKPKTGFLPSPGAPQAEEPQGKGKGTGFVYNSKKGLMLTNAHVVAKAKSVEVTTRDGKKIKGRVLGFDRENDIAVVQLDNKSLPEAKLAGFTDPKKLPIGDWTIAIGNPFGQENTVTVGVLSAVGRTLPVPPNAQGDAFDLTDLLQTDTAINPGNSGGPLCNLAAEVIGINTAIIPYGQGLGFTIPINKAKKIADEIEKHGKVRHPYLGVDVKSITDALKADYGLPDKNGALVVRVRPNSPASQSGLQSGDVIRKMEGKTIKGNKDFVESIGKKKVGDKVKLEILRNNSVQKTLELQVGDRPQV